jgi:hypothetical protein
MTASKTMRKSKDYYVLFVDKPKNIKGLRATLHVGVSC